MAVTILGVQGLLPGTLLSVLSAQCRKLPLQFPEVCTVSEMVWYNRCTCRDLEIDLLFNDFCYWPFLILKLF